MHSFLLRDSAGRVLRRGDHIARGAGMRQHHGIYYGGAGGQDGGQEVIHHAKRDKAAEGKKGSRRRLPTERTVGFPEPSLNLP